jgi:hypothetical protein
MSNYSKKLQDPRWQKKRLEILDRDGFTCQMCMNDKEQLVVHHKRYLKGCEPWEYEPAYLITLCNSCHEKYHAKSDNTHAEPAFPTGRDYEGLTKEEEEFYWLEYVRANLKRNYEGLENGDQELFVGFKLFYARMNDLGFPSRSIHRLHAMRKKWRGLSDTQLLDFRKPIQPPL